VPCAFPIAAACAKLGCGLKRRPAAAAKQGHPRAYANLGILYMNGWGVRRDYAEAFKYLQLAADAGDSGA
jgi:TPR repeat protein